MMLSMKTALGHAIRGLMLIIALLIYTDAMAITPDQATAKIKQLDPQAAVILGNAGGEQQIITINDKRLYIPASTIKVPLVLAAYQLLGEDFRFHTSFYSNKAGDLIIQGQGDPFLTSEEIRLIATKLKQLGYKEFNRLALDDRLFKGLKLAGLGASDNPYDAKFSSLFVNFNTLNMQHTPSGKIVSAEQQTPTLPLMTKLGKNIPCCDKPERINLQGKDKYRRQYVSQLISIIFTEYGINFRQPSGHKIAKISNQQKPIYVHYNSNSLEEVSKKLLLYSNNLISNALLLQFAPDSKSPLQASVTRWQEYLEAQILRTDQIILQEGSGLDPNNKMSAGYMYSVLLAFNGYSDLLPSDEVEDSLYDVGAIYKTGTLTGVYNAAGYIKYSKGLRPFVIFTQNPNNNRKNIINILKLVD